MADTEYTREPFSTDRLEQVIDAYLEDYEMVGEAEDGRDACYQPNENERILIKDAILGLLSDSAWDAEWGKLIAQRVAESAALPSASLGEQREPEDWKLVPIKPTYEMIRAGQNSEGRSTLKNMESHELIWRDMLAASPASKGAGGGGERDAGGVSASGLTQQLVRAVEASDEGHDPFCLAILRGKDCSCGFDQRPEGAAGPLQSRMEGRDAG
jgi:hypothetical protein